MKQQLRRAARRTRDAIPESKASLRARVDRLERELDELRRDGRRESAVAMLAIDIDGFRRLTDRQGTASTQHVYEITHDAILPHRAKRRNRLVSEGPVCPLVHVGGRSYDG